MSAGYLILKKFEAHWRDAIEKRTYEVDSSCGKFYGVPITTCPDIPDGDPRYRGIDRWPVPAMPIEYGKFFTECGHPTEFNNATQFLDDLEKETGRKDGWVTEVSDILKAWDLLEEKEDYEIIFAREERDKTPTPQFCRFLGWDAAYFEMDCFSCICDALFFPRWHGTDKEGVLFREYFNLLNKNGFFEISDEAFAYLKYYLSFDWTERDDNFTAIEVFEVDIDKAAFE